MIFFKFLCIYLGRKKKEERGKGRERERGERREEGCVT